MFSFLKDKVKGAISSITNRFEEEGEEVETPKEEIKEVKKEVVKKPVIKKEKPKKEKEEKPKEEEPKKEVEEEPKPEKKGFFAKITEKVTNKKITGSQFDEMFWELEVELLENNVAFEVIEKIKIDLKHKLINIPLKRGQVEQIIVDSLEDSIREVLDVKTIDLLEKVKEKKPYVIVFIGVNGSGKTTTIAKFAHLLKEQGHSVVLAAADTFRAASIQ